MSGTRHIPLNRSPPRCEVITSYPWPMVVPHTQPMQAGWNYSQLPPRLLQNRRSMARIEKNFFHFALYPDDIGCALVFWWGRTDTGRRRFRNSKSAV